MCPLCAQCRIPWYRGRPRSREFQGAGEDAVRDVEEAPQEPAEAGYDAGDDAEGGGVEGPAGRRSGAVALSASKQCLSKLVKVSAMPSKVSSKALKVVPEGSDVF